MIIYIIYKKNKVVKALHGVKTFTTRAPPPLTAQKRGGNKNRMKQNLLIA
jgi:hypothetical protein